MLAIVETLLAIALVFYLSARFNTLRWLAVAMCISPLLLLRTDESVRLGIEWFDRKAEGYMVEWGEYLNGLPLRSYLWRSALLLGPAVVQFGVIALLARLRAVLIGCAREPSRSFQAIPSNWARVTLAMDTAFPPEVIPEHPRMTAGWIFGWADGRSAESLLQYSCMYALVPALLYRWSLKATSIIYLPLVFILHTTFRGVANLRTKLELIKRSDLTRIGACYAIVFLVAFISKLVLMLTLSHFAEWWNGHPIRAFAALYIAPTEIPKWQLASLTNSVLALGVMLFARAALLRIDLGEPWPEGAVQRALGFTTGVRWVLTIYTILCTAYLTMNAARGLPWPSLGIKWFPWQ